VKIVACSDPFDVPSGLAQQMRLLMENSGDEWHYIENGVQTNQINWDYATNRGIGKINLYPGQNHRNYMFATKEMFSIAKKTEPYLIMACEETQSIEELLQTRWKWPGFMWTLCEWGYMTDPMAKIAEECEKRGWLMVTMAKFSQNLCHQEGYKEVEQMYGMVDPAFQEMTQETQSAWKKSYLSSTKNTDGTSPSQDKKILLFVGRNSPRKNIEGLLGMVQELAKERDDFILIMHTDMSDVNRACDIKIEILTRGIEKHVVVNNMNYMKGVSRDKLNILYNISDLYVSASSQEGFGVPIVEAGACGKTFVIADSTVANEFVGDSVNGMPVEMMKDVDREFTINVQGMKHKVHMPIINHVEMAKKVSWMLDHEQQRIQMGHDFKEWVQANCSVPVVVQKFRSLVDDLNCKEVLAI